ncbi:MAG: GIY-YIG nuclease family protein [Candidatus Gracilibacteria bacterium]|nr:GIY-YIG nuclease family protein [Candidatus Gracilibacteria bacterium]
MYHIYILQCADSTLYTGITVDLERRIEEHNSSNLGARYTSIRRPVKLVYFQVCANRKEASREEMRIKKLSRKEKLELIKMQNNLSYILSYIDS